jgi:hypothetical protein
LSQTSKKITLIIVFILTFAVANFGINKNTSSNFSMAKNFPKEFKGWVGEDLKLEKTNAVFKIMAPQDLLLRFYQKEKVQDPINLTIVMADNKKKIHDPQMCYKLQGFVFEKPQVKKLKNNLNVTYIKAKKENKPYRFIFWYTDLDNNYSTRTEFWKKIILNKLTGKPIKTYGIIISYTPEKNEKNLINFLSDVNNILFKG